MLRGGYGMFYGFLGQRRGDVIQSGFSQNTNIIPSLDNGLTFIGTLTNPFPNGIPEPLGSAQGDRHVPRPGHHLLRSQPQVAAHAAVAGRRSARAARPVGRSRPATSATTARSCRPSRNLNATPNQYLSTTPRARCGADRVSDRERPESVLRAAADDGGDGAAGHEHRARAPAPSVPAVRFGQHDDERRLVLVQRARRSTCSGASRAGTRSDRATPTRSSPRRPSSSNAGDPEPWKGISSVDSPHRLTVNGILELPFGRGRRYGADVNAVVSAFISGWQVVGDLHLPERLPGRLRQHHLHRRPR